MRRKTATIDTNCLIALETVRLFGEISLLFYKVYIPTAVRKEFGKKEKGRPRLRNLVSSFKFLEECEVSDSVRVDWLLLNAKGRRKKAHRGEAEAVIQASQVDASVVLSDDRGGRKWAKGHGLDAHGILWILGQLRSLEVIGPIRPLIQKLQKRGYRLPKREIDKLLTDFGEDA